MATGAQRFLVIYSGVLTLAFGAVVLMGAAATANTKFDTIDVQRINVREPDGGLRMTISGAKRLPGLIVRGKEYPHDRGLAGIIFFNDEGTENGGLVFGGGKDGSGKIVHGGHLSFDQYEQDQVINLEQIEENGVRYAGLMINDAPAHSVIQDIEERPKLEAMPEAERNKLLEQRQKDGYYFTSRLYLGKTRERDSVLNLKDAKGQSRLRLRVTADGAASIEFLDATGKVQRTVTPEAAVSH